MVPNAALQLQPNYTTHWEPSGSTPGAVLFAVRRGGRFWHGFRRAAAAFMAARRSRWTVDFGLYPMHLALFPDRWVQRKCTTRITSRSSGCCRRRRLPALVGCRGGRSTERLRVRSCGRLGYAIGSASIRPSWSVGSPMRRPGRIHRSLRDAGVELPERRTAYGRCSMRASRDRRGL